mgnify:CR=1 FL=1
MEEAKETLFKIEVIGGNLVKVAIDLSVALKLNPWNDGSMWQILNIMFIEILDQFGPLELWLSDKKQGNRLKMNEKLK